MPNRFLVPVGIGNRAAKLTRQGGFLVIEVASPVRRAHEPVNDALHVHLKGLFVQHLGKNRAAPGQGFLGLLPDVVIVHGLEGEAVDDLGRHRLGRARPPRRLEGDDLPALLLVARRVGNLARGSVNLALVRLDLGQRALPSAATVLMFAVSWDMISSILFRASPRLALPRRRGCLWLRP